MSDIKINDILEDLCEENKRLLNELMFANKCLKILINYKTFIDFISNKIKTNLDANESQKIEKLNKDIEEVLKERNQLIRRKQITRNENLSPNTIRSEDENNISNKSIDRSEDGLRSEVNNNSEEINFKDYIKSNILNKSVVNDNQNDIKSKDESNDGSQYHQMDDNYSPEDNIVDDNTNDNKLDIESDSLKKDKQKKSETEKYEEKLRNARKKYICPHKDCNRYMNYRSLRTHVLRVHSKSPFVCNIDNCNEKFRSFIKYQNHLKTHPSFELQLSEIKAKKYKSVNAGMYKLKKYTCKVCKQKFVSFKEHDKHICILPFVCNICDKQYKTKKYLKDHTNRVHNGIGVFTCDVCNITLKSRDNLRIHRQRVHRMTKKFKCEDNDCNKMFKSRYEANSHYKKLHSNEPKTVRCSWPGCDYAGWNESCLKEHVAVHDSQPRFVCDWPECGKAVRHRHTLQQHMDSHYNNKKYVCEWPGCTFRTVTDELITNEWLSEGNHSFTAY